MALNASIMVSLNEIKFYFIFLRQRVLWQFLLRFGDKDKTSRRLYFQRQIYDYAIISYLCACTT